MAAICPLIIIFIATASPPTPFRHDGGLSPTHLEGNQSNIHGHELNITAARGVRREASPAKPCSLPAWLPVFAESHTALLCPYFKGGIIIVFFKTVKWFHAAVSSHFGLLLQNIFESDKSERLFHHDSNFSGGGGGVIFKHSNEYDVLIVLFMNTSIRCLWPCLE